jgi:hypothetical protein
MLTYRNGLKLVTAILRLSIGWHSTCCQPVLKVNHSLYEGMALNFTAVHACDRVLLMQRVDLSFLITERHAVLMVVGI